VEDAACAIGATYEDVPIGGHSDLVAFSFHPRKVLTTGEGGMVMTGRAEWAERLCQLREHGSSMSAAARHVSGAPVIERYLETGFNYRMTDIQAAVGLVQLAKLDLMIERRRAQARRYHEAFADIVGLVTATDPPYGTTTFQSFWVLLPDDASISRDDLLARLQEAGISARRGIMAAHLEPAYAGHPHAELPVSERLTARSVILPLFHTMTDAEQDRVVEVFRSHVGGS
jgi:perosamine synthetase